MSSLFPHKLRFVFISRHIVQCVVFALLLLLATVTLAAITDDSYTTNEDNTLTVTAPGILSNDTDSVALMIVQMSDPSHGALTLNNDGSFSYTPAANYNGLDSFTYLTNDGTMDSNVATVNITVTAVNDAPLATDDSYTTDEDSTLTVPAPGVLTNDTDVDGDTLSAVKVTGPSHGTLTLNSDGSFSYTPEANYSGSDSFSYLVNDGTGDSNIATVSITVSPVNDAPVATDDSYTTNEDSTLTITAPGVLANDTDVDGDTLSAVKVTDPSHGTLTLNSDGSFSYTPEANYSGPDSFSYLVNDGTLDSNIATVSITVTPVNDAPVATDDSYTTNEDSTLTITTPGLLTNETDVDGDTLTAVKVSDPSHGTLTLNSDGSFSYTPDANYSGSDSFSYLVNDGTGDSNIATVSITVSPVNDAPVATDDSYTTNEDNTLTITAPGVLANDTDADGDTLTAVKVADPSHGILTLNSDGSFNYTPEASYSGPDSFSYLVNDGTLDSNIATVSITVSPVNDASVAVDDSYTIDEDSTLTITALGVLANDTDADGDTLTAVKVADPSHGTLTLNSDGSFSYTPETHYSGPDSFSYRVNDGTLDSNIATVNITVTAVNDAPTAVDDSYTTDEDSTLDITVPGLLANDTDIDSATLTAIKVTDPRHGTLTLNSDGSFSYTPEANYSGSDSFSYLVNDGTGDSNIATVSITVSPVNDAPVATDDSYTTNEDNTLTITAPGVLANDTDADGDTLTAVKVADPSHGTLTLNSDGSFSYTPEANYSGSDSFSYLVNDGSVDSNVATVNITVTAVNDAPVAVNDSYTIDEDNTLTVTVPGVLANDTDADGDTLTAVKVADPSHGTLTLNSDGSFSYTPEANYNGPDSFNYRVNDGTVDSNVSTVTIMVLPVDDISTAVDDNYTTNEDSTLTVAAPGMLTNDTNVDSDLLTTVKVTDPSHGTLTLNSDGSFSYTPEANYSGPDSFSYLVNDGTLDSNIATVSITVAPVNDAPVAVDDSYTIDEDNTLTVPAPGVLTNDTDVDSATLTAVKVSDPSHGTLTLNSDGSFSYTPEANYSGPDSFSYLVNDGTLDSNIATVSLTVTPVNDAPTAVDDSYTINEDGTLDITAPGLLTNDTEADGDTLTAVKVADPSHGTLTLNSDGSFSYTPEANYSGSDSFSYLVNDGTGDSNIATVSITVSPVNDAPVATDDSYTTNEDNTLTITAPGVLANDTDADGDTLTAVKVADPSHGTLTLNSDGSFCYTPEANYSGQDSFSYLVNDGTLDSNIATVSLTVTPVNDAPTAVDDSYTINEDGTLDITAPGLLTNDTEADGETLTAVKVADPSHGTLTLNSDGSFSYTSEANYSGPDSFSYLVNDGTLNSNIATVSLTVTPVNDAPTAVDDSYTTDEDSILTITAPGVLANDTDVDSNSLSAIKVTDTSHGTLTFNSDGSFSYTPEANYSGPDSFTYTVNDGSLDSNVASVNITVTPVNDAPVATDDSYTMDEDSTLTITAPGLLANDTDVDSDTLTAVKVSDPSHGTLTLNSDGSFSYTPEANYSGPDSFSYLVNDGTGDSNVATVTITVTAVNDAPVATDDSYTTNEDNTLTITAPGVLANDTDADGDTLTAVKVADPSHGTLTLNSDGSFSYTPETHYSGPDSFSYRVNDGTLDSNIATVNITVTAVNDAPTAVDDSYTTDEDSTLDITVPGLLANDTDIDSATLTAIKVTDPRHGTLTLNSDGSFSYTPEANYSGSDSFSYLVNDGTGDSNIATVSITVSPVNDAPVATDDSYTTNEDNTLTITAPGVLANDTDADGDTLTAVKVADPSHGTLTLNSDGSFSYTPEANYSGSDSFSYLVNDGSVDSNVATVNITVTAVNDAPVAVNDSYTIDEDNTLTVTVPGVLANDTDADGDTLTAVKVADPSHGTLTLNSDGSFSYTPEANYNGPDSFNYRVNDGTVDSNVSTVTIMVLPVDDISTAVDDNYTTNEDSTLTVAAPGMLTNDTNVDSDLLTTVKVTDPSHGTLTLNSDGSFSYTPEANYSGPDSFSYLVNDGTLDSNIATVSITVAPVNDAPVAVDDSYTIDEDNTLTVPAPGVLTNDTDVDSATLTAVKVSDPSHGTLTLNSDGSFSYTPEANYSGPDSFSYLVNDGTLDSNIATVSLTVTPVNDAPTAVDDSYTINEDGTLDITAPGLLTNDTVADGETLTAVKVADPSHGTLTLNSDGSFSYTSEANYSGPDSFSYLVNDGTLNSNIATVSLTVTPVNDAPTAVDDSYTTDEDSILTITAPGVLANDTDVDSNSLSAIKVTDTSHGTLTFNSDGSFSYTPEANYSGPDSFTYTVNDGSLDSNVASVNIIVTPVNDAPVATDDSYTMDEDSTLTITAPGVLANDTDVDSDTLTAVKVSDPSHGTLTLNSDGSFSYTPEANYSGPDSFSYLVNDGTGDSNVATVTITVTAVNDAPVATDDSYTTNEDSTLTITAPGLLTNDTDVDGDTLTAVKISDPSHGTLTLNSDGSFSYTPEDNYCGQDSFNYSANDGNLNSNDATVNITVTAVNDAPTAVDDSYTIDEDSTLTITASGVLTNDSDVDSATLTVVKVAEPSHGTLTLNSDGSFSYTPAANYNGLDSFAYLVNDGELNSNVAIVTITVTPVNDAPPEAADDSYTTDEDSTLTVTLPGLLTNDTDVDGDTLTAVKVSDPSHGTLTFNNDGSFSYTPEANYSGPDSFTYLANDGSLDSNIATVTIMVTPVNDAPNAVDDRYTTDEDSILTVTAPGVLTNDTDVDSNSLSAIKVTDPSHGTLTLNSDGSFCYTPEANYNGPDSFSYRVNDGTVDSNVATVTIMVSPVDDTSTALDDNYTTNEDSTLNVAAPGVLVNDTNVDSDLLTAVKVTDPSHGVLIFNSDGSFSYAPEADYSGPDRFTYRVNDGTLGSNVATINITVTVVNDAPTAVDDIFTTDEDSTLDIAAPGVLANDTDVDSISLTAVKVTDPSHGTLTLNGDGSFSYTPEANYSGPDSFTYLVNDGNLDSNVATVSIMVTAVNDAPDTADDSYVTSENVMLTVVAPGVLENDSDVDNLILTPVKVSDPLHGTVTFNSDGSFSYTPTTNYYGPDSFTYLVSDGSLNSNVATVNITVTAVNDVPRAIDESYSTDEDTTLTVLAPGVLANDTDVDSTTLTAVQVTESSHGTVTLNSDGSFSYTPDANYTGLDSFTYLVDDGFLDSNVATVNITVTPVNDAPYAANDNYAMNENSTLLMTAPGILTNDTDADGETLVAVKVTDPSHGTLTLNRDGSFTYTPVINYYGSDSFSYYANDGVVSSNIATVNITVNEVNRYLPDLYLRSITDPIYTGVNIYSRDGASQTVGQSVANGVKVTYDVRVQNNGKVAEALIVTALAVPTGWTGVYKSGSKVITGQITGKGWTTPVLAVGGTATVTLEVTPGTKVIGGAIATQTLTVTSSGNKTIQDVGVINTTVLVTHGVDLSLRPSTVTTYTGADVYTLDGTDQTVTLSIAKGAKATYYVRVKNNGNVPESFTIHSSSAPVGWTVAYNAGTTVITGAITTAGWMTPVLNPAAAVLITVYVTPGTSVQGGADATQTITATSSGNTAKQDVGVIKTFVPVVQRPDLYLRPSTVSTYTGMGVYSLDGTNQVVGQSIVKGQVAYYVQVKNNGNIPESFMISGSSAPSGWTVAYNLGGKVITNAITTTGWTTPVLNSAATVLITVYVTPGSTVIGGEIATQVIRVTSTGDPTKQDVGVITTTVPVLNRPDLLLRPSTVTSYSGSNVYNLDGTNQTVSQSVENGAKATYYITVRNNGNVSEPLTITAPSAPAGWSVVYNLGATVITDEMTTTGWVTPVLNPAATVVLTVFVTPDFDRTVGEVATQVVTVTSTGDLTKQDVGVLHTTTLLQAAPTITGFTPLSGSSGQQVTITGTNLNGATVVTFNGAVAIFNVVRATSITATVPADAMIGKISVTTPGGTAESTEDFTVTEVAGTAGTNPMDGAAIVWVPGGSFTMGTEYGAWWTAPYTQQVTLSGFWTYQYEVTVAQYRAFCTATSRQLPIFPSGYSWVDKSGWSDPALQQHPMVNVTWADAVAYAEWAGASLPTEAQWEYAVRGPAERNYPWGGAATTADPYNSWDQTKCANDSNSRNAGISTWPVGSFPTSASWCGAQDLSGNAWEWCADWFGSYATEPVTNPTGPATGDFRVLRGGSWSDSSAGSFRGANRFVDNPGNVMSNYGFRCVKSMPFAGLPIPTLSNFTPSNGPIGQMVTLTGTNFSEATEVAFNGLPAVTFTVISPTSMTVVVPTGATTGKISVTTPGGLASSKTNFTVISPPTITGFTPAIGTVGQQVSLTGTNFTGATSVTCNGTAASFIVVSATAITATIASGTTTGKIVVTTPGGTVTSATDFIVINSDDIIKATYYVSITGSDTTGTGSLLQPFATPNRALSLMKNGDSMIIGAGTFVLSPTSSAPGLAIKLDNITIQGAGIDATILKFGARCQEVIMVTSNGVSISDLTVDALAGVTGHHVLTFQSCAGGIVTRVKVTGGYAGSDGIVCHSPTGVLTSVTCNNCIATATGNDGFKISTTSLNSNLTLIDCEAYLNQNSSTSDGAANDGVGNMIVIRGKYYSNNKSGVTVITGVEGANVECYEVEAYDNGWYSSTRGLELSGNIIWGCNVHDARYDGVLVAPGVPGSMVAYTKITGSSNQNSRYGIRPPSGRSCQIIGCEVSGFVSNAAATGIYADSGIGSLTALIESCYVHDCKDGITHCNAGTVIRNCRVVRCSNRALSVINATSIYNTILEGTTYAVVGSAALTSRNNLFYGPIYGWSPDVSDVEGVADLEPDGTPTAGGNCDIGTGYVFSGVIRPLDLLGNPRNSQEADCRGPIFPQR